MDVKFIVISSISARYTERTGAWSLDVFYNVGEIAAKARHRLDNTGGMYNCETNKL